MKIEIPYKVKYIIDKFYNNNFEAFMVGGCIRDSLLNKQPKDYDIATSAKPKDIINLFDKTIETGIEHGTVTVMIDNEAFEVTTYREDGEYQDNRRPSEVLFVTNIKDDLSRRDFTINSFAYNSKEGLIDFFNGIDDLNNNLIRSVGDPNKRFNEDALRMLRAIRFSSQLDFDIEFNTLAAINYNSHLIKNISIERIRDELCKILTSQKPRKGLTLLYNCGLLKYILPELVECVDFNQHNPYHSEDIFNHTLSVVENSPNILTIRLASLLHDIGKPYTFFLDENGLGKFFGHNTKGEKIANTILKRLRFDNNTIKTVSLLVREHMNVLDNPTKSAIKRLISRVGEENIKSLFSLQEADIRSLNNFEQPLNKLITMKNLSLEILNSKEPFSIKDLNIDGNILINKLNIQPGKIIGDILLHLLDLVIDNPDLNTADSLIYEAEKFILDRESN